jgi:hypothetical protein
VTILYWARYALLLLLVAAVVWIAYAARSER